MASEGVPRIGWAGVVRFVAELALLAALAVVGWGLGRLVDPSGFAPLSTAIMTPVAAAGAWATVVAPEAERRWPDPWRLLVEVALFGAACGGLVWCGHPWWSVALGVAYVVSAHHGRDTR